MFFAIRFIIIWIIWFLYANKKRWKEIIPVSIFASFIALATDHVMQYGYMLWDYQKGHSLIKYLSDDLGIYMVVTYLFIQWLPEKHTPKNLFKYFLKWTTVAILIEVLHVKFGYMKHYNGWTHIHSYVADWFLFWLFYKYYKVLKLEKLSHYNNICSDIEHIGDIVVSLDVNGIITDCKSLWLETYDIYPKSLISKSVNEFRGLVNKESHFYAYRKVMEGKKYNFRWEWIDKEGKNHCFEAQLYPIKESVGNVTGIVSISNETFSSHKFDNFDELHLTN